MLLRDGRTLLVPVFAHGVYCFNMSVGAAGDAAELLWIRPLAGSLEHDVGVDEARGRVYAGSYAQDMTAIDLKTGAVVWTVTGLGHSVQESSPVIDGDGWVMGAALFFFLFFLSKFFVFCFLVFFFSSFILVLDPDSSFWLNLYYPFNQFLVFFAIVIYFFHSSQQHLFWRKRWQVLEP
jgi:hypothetical protein